MSGWGAKIKKLRENSNMTQEDLAEKLSVTSATINRWEHEKTIPDVMMGIALGKIFMVRVEQIFS